MHTTPEHKNTHVTESLSECLFFHWIKMFLVSKFLCHALEFCPSYYVISVVIISTEDRSQLLLQEFTHPKICSIEQTTCRPSQITSWNEGMFSVKISLEERE